LKKTIIFAIQGEGRGHLTQSLALKNKLEAAGYHVPAVIIGKSPLRMLPEFFKAKIGAEIIEVESPNFVMDKNAKGLDIPRTLRVNFNKLGIFKKSMQTIQDSISKYKPDLLVNFYEPLIGWMNMKNKIDVKTVCIAHQYVFHHPEYKFHGGNITDMLAIKMFTLLTANKAVKRFALSLYPLKELVKDNIVVIPPILRPELFEPKVEDDKFILVYLLNEGYLQEVIDFHKKNPTYPIHCFTDKKDIVDGQEIQPGLFTHKLHDTNFLNKMATCSGLVCTAGFESVAEAMYLGKPALMIPVKGHFEQFCNSRDAQQCGAGIYDSSFNIQKLIDYMPHYNSTAPAFREWLNQGDSFLLDHIKSVI
jgi:uncharacterized protein (TIGR00661 family)